MYKVIVDKEAAKSIKHLPKRDQTKILQKIESLEHNPYPNNIKALKGKHSGYYRLRSGNYRIIYAVQDKVLVVLVLKVGHRKKIYN